MQTHTEILPASEPMFIDTEIDRAAAAVAPPMNPMESLRYCLDKVEGLPCGTPAEEQNWDVRRRIVDAYGADILGSITVPTVTALDTALAVEHFGAETQYHDVITYYRALDQNRERLARLEHNGIFRANIRSLFGRIARHISGS